MRSILFSTALVFAAIMSSGCATLKVENRFRADEQENAAAADCGNTPCRNANCRLCVGRVTSGIGRLGQLAPGFGRLGIVCPSCGMLGGRCQCNHETPEENHAPYTSEFSGPFGPPTGTFSYPYYTTRAPRDFLMANPPSIGR